MKKRALYIQSKWTERSFLFIFLYKNEDKKLIEQEEERRFSFFPAVKLNSQKLINKTNKKGTTELVIFKCNDLSYFHYLASFKKYIGWT